MKIINLCSGSKGNATLIEYEKNSYILIDCGSTSLFKKLESLNISLESIKYLFITHSHSDHILNIEKFDSKIIYCLDKTIKKDHNILKAYKEYNFDKFSVMPLKTSHDVIDSCCYVFNINNISVVYLTDCGKIPAKTESFLSNKNIYIFESNYDLTMLKESGREKWLINRIKSTKGHLGNLQTNFYLKKYVGSATNLICLAHLSEDCNTKELVQQTLNEFKNITSYIFDQWEITEIDYAQN